MSEFLMEASASRTGRKQTIAYFCMEIGLDAALPTYGGGLGILAGDTLRAAADLGIPMVGVTLLYRKGYLRQHLDLQGTQTESPVVWRPEQHLEALPQRASITIEGRPVQVRAWRYLVPGPDQHSVPVYFLDTALPENGPWDQSLTGQLYGGDTRYRLGQEVLLGLGGMAMLRALGYSSFDSYHMNEGHCAFVPLALLEEQCNTRHPFRVTEEAIEGVRRRCVFTTHTPVPAGHDQFPVELARQVLGNELTGALDAAGIIVDGCLNMSRLALTLSGYVNGVSRRHGEVSSKLFPDRSIEFITNGVHAPTWVSPAFARLYDRYIPQWRGNNMHLRGAVNIPLAEVQEAHREAKTALLQEVAQRTGVQLDPNAMTIGFARRAAAYKRADLLFTDLDQLRRIARESGPFQVLYAGKAHPRDEFSKGMIQRVFSAAATLKDTVPVLYLEDYDIALAKLLCTGVDLWLNTPQKPLEASGTSGMKAALNGIPSLSVLDGWWIEGHIEGVTGWSIGEPGEGASDPARESISLYQKLEQVVLPIFYRHPLIYAQIMRSAISLNGSFFNTHRMLSQYLERAYPPGSNSSRLTPVPHTAPA